MGDNYSRLRLGQCVDRTDVWLCRQPPSGFDSQAQRHRDVSLFLGCSSSPLRRHSISGHRCVGCGSLPLPPLFKTCPRDLDPLRGRLKFSSSLCPGLLARPRLEHSSARRTNPLLIVEALGSRPWQSGL